MHINDLLDHIKRTLSPEEAKHIQHMRDIGWGKVTVEIKDSKPVMGHEPMKDVKYTS